MRLQLRHVIFGVYVASCSAGFLLLMAIVLWEVRPRYVEAMRNSMDDTARMLGLMLETRLDSLPSSDSPGAPPRELAAPELAQAWSRELASLQRMAGRMRVYVTDNRGIVIGDSADGRDIGRDYTRRPEMAAYFAKLYSSGESLYQRGAGADNIDLVNGELRVTTPVVLRGQTVAMVGVGRSLSSAQQFILRARVRLGIEALAIAAVMVLTGWWIANRVTAAIERLTTYVRAAGSDPAAKPPVSLAEEINELGGAFEKLRRELEGKAYVEQYTQALAHELKSPLSAIRGAAELLTENPPEPDRQRFLANLRQETARLTQLVERLLGLAAVEARQGKHEKRPVDLAALARELAAGATASAQARGKTISVEGAARLLVHGEGDLLRQALDSLLQNALEFSPEQGRVMLSLAEDATHVTVTITDEGPGIPEWALPRVFERFYSLPRPDGGRKSSGLGLNLAREVARLHGGDATVENRSDRSGVKARLSLRLE